MRSLTERAVLLSRDDLLPFMSGLVTAWVSSPDGQLTIEAVPMQDGTWTYRVLRDGKRLAEDGEREVFRAICKTYVPLAPREPLEAVKAILATQLRPAFPEMTCAQEAAIVAHLRAKGLGDGNS